MRSAADPPARGAEAEALTPVIASSICLIEDGRLYYRGEDAIRLSDTAILEDVARLLWRAELDNGEVAANIAGRGCDGALPG